MRHGMCVSGFPHDNNKRAWFPKHQHHIYHLSHQTHSYDMQLLFGQKGRGRPMLEISGHGSEMYCAVRIKLNPNTEVFRFYVHWISELSQFSVLFLLQCRQQKWPIHLIVVILFSGLLQTFGLFKNGDQNHKEETSKICIFYPIVSLENLMGCVTLSYM